MPKKRLHAARVARTRAFQRNYGAVVAGKLLDHLEDKIPVIMDVVLLDMLGPDVSPKKRAKFGAKVIEKFLKPWARDINLLLVKQADKRVTRLLKK